MDAQPRFKLNLGQKSKTIFDVADELVRIVVGPRPGEWRQVTAKLAHIIDVLSEIVVDFSVKRFV